MPTFYPPGTRKGNRFYVVRGSVHGREYEVQTHTRDKKAAGQEWKRFSDTVRNERARSRRSAPETFGDVADAYLAAAVRSKNERRYVERLKSDLGAILIGEVRHSDIVGAANRLYPDATPQTKNRQAIAPAAAIMHMAARDDLCGYLRVERFKESEPETRRPRDGVGLLLLANTDGDKRRLLAFLFYQGWRISEALSLRWENVRLRERVLRVYVGKAGRWKDIVMAPETFEALAENPQDEGFVFPWRSRSGVYKWLKPLRKRLGIVFTPHMARHDFGGQLREQGATSRDLVDVGTWTSEKSTARYQHAGSDHAKNIISRRRLGDEPGETGKKSGDATG